MAEELVSRGVSARRRLRSPLPALAAFAALVCGLEFLGQRVERGSGHNPLDEWEHLPLLQPHVCGQLGTQLPERAVICKCRGGQRVGAVANHRVLAECS